MPPVIGSGVGGIDAERFDGVDRLQHALDLRPAGEAQEDFAAGAHIRDGREGFAGHDGAQDVDPRDDRAEVVRGPADIGKDAARREAEDAAAAIEDLLADIVAESDPVLDPLLDPGQLDMGEHVRWRTHARLRRLRGTRAPAERAAYRRP